MVERARDDLFARTSRRRADFVFDESVAAVFDDMLERSIPFYVEQQAMVADLAARYWLPGTLVVDLGCSTGTTLVAVCAELPEARAAGVDSSSAMLTRAAETLERAGMAGRVDLVNADLAAGLDGLGLARASVVTVCWTLQFLQPERRLALLRDAFELLVPGGVLLLAEKTVAMDSAVDELFTSLYYELKRRSGYSATEIARKRESLEGVLVPMTIADNLAILREAGFPAPATFFQWCPFAAFLAVKPTG